MEMGILETIATSLALALPAFPVILLGAWLSTKSWFYYPIVLAGTGWIAFIVCAQVGNSLQAMGTNIAITVMMWTIPAIMFIALNIGTIFNIQTLRIKKK